MDLTVENSFKITVRFLENYYFSTYISDIGGLLSDMILIDNNKIADPAIWNDWEESVKKIKEKISNQISFDEAYQIMYVFLEDYGCRSQSNEVKQLLNLIKIDNNIIDKKTIAWKDWERAISKTLHEK